MRLDVGLVLVVAGVLGLSASAAASSTTYIPAGGSEQQFVVPPLVSQVEVAAIGGAGGGLGFFGPGGSGAKVTATLIVQPGQTLYVDFGGGGLGGGNGGDASDIRTESGELSSRLIVAGGGGGRGTGGSAGGSAIGESGGAGDAYQEPSQEAGGGGGGTLTAGGAGGVSFEFPGADGELGQGGGGGCLGGGGGGGGYYGGGGGGAVDPCSGAGGGAGSSFITSVGASGGSFASGQGEPQKVVITYTASPPASLALSPQTATNPIDTEHCVTAHVEDAGANAVPDTTVRFSTEGATATSGSAATDSAGDAQYCYTGPPLPGSDTITAYADTNEDDAINPGEPGDTATKSWVIDKTTTPCTIKVTNGGWIVTDDADRSSFGGNAKETATGTDSGQQLYQDKGPADPQTVRSTEILDVACSGDFKRASIFGTATINGAGSHTFRIDVQDLGEPGKNVDTYRIRIEGGYDSGEHKLRGGNVQIH
jgi:hypothetical protein